MTRKHFKRYVHESLSPSTQAAYSSDLKAFIRWGGKIPATPQLIARYLAKRAETHKISTLRRHLASIARAHVVKGIDSPTSSPLVRATVRGIMRVHGTKQKQALPLTLALMRKLGGHVPGVSRLRDARDRAILLVGFAGGFRRSELAGLCYGDLKFSSKGVVIRLQVSKTDQYKQGRDVALVRSNSPLCPVKALSRWITLATKRCAIDATTPLFRRIDYNDQILDQGLRGQAIGIILQKRMETLSIDARGFSAHSLRSGFVSTAAKIGVPLWAIQRQTGHKSVNMVHRYIRGLGVFEKNASASVLNAK